MLNYYEYADILRLQQEDVAKKHNFHRTQRPEYNQGHDNPSPIQHRSQVNSHQPVRPGSGNLTPILETDREAHERSTSSRSQRCSSVERPNSTSTPRYVTVPVPADIDPVMLEVCINILSQSRHGKSEERSPNKELVKVDNRQQVEDRSVVHSRKYSGRPPALQNGKDSRQASPLRLRIRPKSSPHSEMAKQSIVRAKTEQKFDRENKGIPHADMKVSNRKDAYDYVTGTRRLTMHPNCPTKDEPVETQSKPIIVRPRARANVNSLYRIQRPLAPPPDEPVPDDNPNYREDDGQICPDSELRLNLPKSPKYTQYAMEYQDRNNFKQKSKNPETESDKLQRHQNAPIKSDPNERSRKGRGDLKPQKPGRFESRSKEETEQGEDEPSFVRQSPSTYDTKTALRIKLPVGTKCKESNFYASVRHSRSLESINRESQPPGQHIERHRSHDILKLEGGGDMSNEEGRLNQYTSDPDAINPDSLRGYIDTYQVEMHVQRKRALASQRQTRPKTAPGPSSLHEKEQIEAERKRKQKLLRSAIKGWGSPTLVFKPKANPNHKGNSPLMIRPVGNRNQPIHIVRDNSTVHQSMKVMPVNTSRKTPEFRGDPNDAYSYQNGGPPPPKETVELKLRVKRRSRPRTPGPALAEADNTNNTGYHSTRDQQAGLMKPCGSTTPPHHVPIRAKSALARTFNEHRFNRPQTAISVKSNPSQGQPRSALEKLVVFGSQMRTETPFEEYSTGYWMDGPELEGEHNWGFMAEFDAKGRPKTPKQLPEHVNMYSTNVPNTNSGNYGSRLNTEVGQLMQNMEFNFNTERRKKKLGNDLICY